MRKQRTSDAYRVWLSEIMLQQTTSEGRSGPIPKKFIARWPDVTALGRASLDDVLRRWAGSATTRARATSTTARGCGGARPWLVFPRYRQTVWARCRASGPYIAAAIAAIAFDRIASPVDGNIERVVSRLFVVEERVPQAEAADPAIGGDAARRLSRAGDSAQALSMDVPAELLLDARANQAGLRRTCPGLSDE